jgi:TRAP transporter 4TM/12TM fusion protein
MATSTPLDDQLDGPVLAEGLDDEPVESNRRIYEGRTYLVIAGMAAFYAIFHMAALNGWSIERWTGVSIPGLPSFPMETWDFRIVHIAGALSLGFLFYAGGTGFPENDRGARPVKIAAALLALPALLAIGTTAYFMWVISTGQVPEMSGQQTWPAIGKSPLAAIEIWYYGVPLLIATAGAIVLSWVTRRPRGVVSPADIVLMLCAVAVASYLIPIFGTTARNSTGTSFAPLGISFAATAGTALVLELTRRVAGLALVIIAGVFLAYTFAAHLLPGILAVDKPYTWQRFFSQVYTDAGILGPTTAVSSTYIILFIIFAAFLQASKVGDYFVNFAFAAAGKSRGGPAKVAIFASGLMGMINGTSAGNVVATGSLTIPLMKKVGYKPTTAGAVEAAASTGGQIMPPIMGAGAFIMAEITGIPYSDIAIAAILPAVLYFTSIYFMVDFEAAKLGMRGMREDELPKFKDMIRRVFLFVPIIILIAALFMGYSVIRAGTLATAAAAVVSWFTPYRMGVKSVTKAFEIAGVMSIQIITVCACAGIIVGVISLTGVGARFSSVLLNVAEANQLLALFFAMCIAILLGMGMPTTAAYAVAASVVAPGLINLGIPPLTAHFFVFYFAVVSAITPPVALASYAAAGISGANPMATSVASFKIGIAAFIVPFMFFYNAALLMQGAPVDVAGEMVLQPANWLEVLRAAFTAIFGVYLLSAGIQGWWIGALAAWYIRVALIVTALLMIEGGIWSDFIGAGSAVALFLLARFTRQQSKTATL